jgi:hypothetical protein
VPAVGLTRKLFLPIATGLMLVAFVVESAAKLWLGDAARQAVLSAGTPRPGIGIPGLAVLDGLLLLTLLFMTLTDLGVKASVMGRLQGIVMLIVSILTVIATFFLIIADIALLLLMVGLLLAVPFGTIAYGVMFGHFDRSGAAITLGILMVLKLAAACLLVLHSLQTLKSKALVLLFAFSILLTLLLSFLHGLVPGFLVSITDAIGGLVALVVGIVYAVYYAVSSIRSVLKILNLGKLGSETVTAR